MSLINQVNLLIFQLLSLQKSSFVENAYWALFEYNLPILIINYNL